MNLSGIQNHHLSYNEKRAKENLNLAFFSGFSSQFYKGEDGDDQTQHLLKIIRSEDNDYSHAADADDDDDDNALL